MDPSAFGLQNIYDAHGFSVSATGLFIVFVTLAVIATAIAMTPHLLTVINKFVPEVVAPPPKPKGPAVVVGANEAAVAAIAVALHHERSSRGN